MSNVAFGRYKRMVQAFWDPEPTNDDLSGTCIWCLGKEYASQPLVNGEPEAKAQTEEVPVPNDPHSSRQVPEKIKPSAPNGITPREPEAKPPESDPERGWPPEFLDDCESRIWLTYRSNFPGIKKSSEASMTLSVRLRSLGDQAGFTSDTGWGCMIRSGQSLLANALVILRLGRGVLPMLQVQRVLT